MDDTIRLPNCPEFEHDEASGVYRARYDWSADEPLSTAVVVAVGAIADIDPLDLPPLRNSVDPDALDDIFAPTPRRHNRHEGSVEFSLADHWVVVSANGTIEIRPPE